MTVFTGFCRIRKVPFIQMMFAAALVTVAANDEGKNAFSWRQHRPGLAWWVGFSSSGGVVGGTYSAVQSSSFIMKLIPMLFVVAFPRGGNTV